MTVRIVIHSYAPIVSRVVGWFRATLSVVWSLVHASGYLVCRGLVNADTVNDVRKLGEQKFIARSDEASAVGDSPLMRWTPATFDHSAPATDAELHALLHDPSLVSAASQLLGNAPARVYYGMLAVVPPNGGSGLPWHSDNMWVWPNLACTFANQKQCLQLVQDVDRVADGAATFLGIRTYLEGR